MDLSSWQNFYVIVGSSAGALVGLQFVVIALVGNLRGRIDVEANDAFGTPVVVHFGAALAIAAIMSAPWPSLYGPFISMGILGLAGIAYSAIAIRRACRQKHYLPVLEDWIWYAGVPVTIYAAITLAAILLRSSRKFALFTIAGAVLALLLVGIRNAWDMVTYTVVAGDRKDNANLD